MGVVIISISASVPFSIPAWRRVLNSFRYFLYQLKNNFSKFSWEILDEKRFDGITFGLDINFYDSCQKKFVAIAYSKVHLKEK